MFSSNGRSNAQGVITVTNIYAPTQDQASTQIDFIDRLEQATSDSLAPNIILAGDLNLCMDPALDRNSFPPDHANTRYKDRITALADSLLLTDVWHQLHPNTKQFSYRRSSYASRLDYWFVSEHLMGPETRSSIQSTPLSDHAIITLKVGPKPYPRGPGLWKFNNSLLQEPDFTERINTTIENVINSPCPENPNSKWEWLKFKIKEQTIKFSKELHSAKRQVIDDLQKSYERLTVRMDAGDTGLRDEVESIEREIREIHLEAANKTILRSRANWALHGKDPQSTS